MVTINGITKDYNRAFGLMLELNKQIKQLKVTKDTYYR